MRRKIRCPWHNDKTASLVQYGDKWMCFGACHKLYLNKEVEDKTNSTYQCDEEVDDAEDLSITFDYIKTLPKKEIRGLSLPADERGYYLVWPDSAYYKYRLWNPGTRPKYLGPKGHKPPLFWASRTQKATLSVVEGEINALSVALACPEWDVCSPGSASMFTSTNLEQHLTIFKTYSKVIVILDDDPAGLKGLIETKALFLYKIPFTQFIKISPDANEILLEKGKEALRSKLQGTNNK